MSPRVLALFAKAPEPGHVKTRLCPPLSSGAAADLYRAMLLDVLEQHAAARDLERVIWYTPTSSFAWFRDHAPSGYRLLPQYGTDLGARMAQVFRVHHAEGFRRIVLRGTDSPTLPEDRVPLAFEGLERSDLVVCPDLDGGYNLVGLRAPSPALFELQMSRASVLEKTLERAGKLGLAFEVLAPHYDIDTADDLERAILDLTAQRTPRTLHWVHTAR